MRETVRLYLQLGRAHGAAFTAGTALVGAFTSGRELGYHDVVAILAVGFAYHFFGCSLNEVADVDLDASVPELAHKPLVSGAISPKAARIFVLGSLGAMVALSALLKHSPLATVLLVLAIALGAYYDVKGKRTPWMGELSLGVGFAAFTLWGAAAMGAITPLTIVAAVEVCIAVNHCTWGGFMKDVETDRRQGIPTRPVAWGYRHGVPITFLDRNFLYAFGMKALAVSVYLVPALASAGVLPSLHFGGQREVTLAGVALSPISVSMTYLVFFFLVGLPGQVFVLYRLLGVHDRDSFTSMVVFDLAVTWVMAAGLLVDLVGWIGAAGIFLLPIAGAAFFNRIVYGTTLLPRV